MAKVSKDFGGKDVAVKFFPNREMARLRDFLDINEDSPRDIENRIKRDIQISECTLNLAAA